jgi:signal transduction protein with GAF and PtsI domain
MMRGRYTTDALIDALCELPDVDTVAMYVVDERQQLLVPRAVSGGHAASLETLTIPIGERLSGWVAAVSEPMSNADAALDLFDKDAERLESALAIPCVGPDQSRAVITLYATRRAAFGPVHERLVHAALGLLVNRGNSVQEARRRLRSVMTADKPCLER